MSYPHLVDVKLGMGVPYSVNKGIGKDKYKTKMSSAPLWLKFVRFGGKGGLLSKLDWEAARL